MTGPEAALFQVGGTSVDERTAALLQLIAGDPIHDADRRRIVEAIVRDGREHRGLVDMNRVRTTLADNRGNLRVYPRVIGAVVSALAQKKALVHAGWIVNTDSHSRNTGRPLRRWRLSNELMSGGDVSC